MTKALAWIVEDSTLEAQAACNALSGQFDCTVFRTCAPALERLAAGESPDVLILDWVLPEMSGVDACRFIRNTYDEVRLPILLVTVRRDSADVVEGLDAGANDFVSKPFVPAELLARTKTLARTRNLYQRGIQAEALARSRADFERQLIGIVSHDLRNPLHTISLSAHLLLGQSGMDPQSTKFLARIQSSAQRGARMVNDLLDFTQARLGGGIPVAASFGNVHSIVRQVVEDLEVTAPDRHVLFSSAGDGDGHWDLERIAQVVLNLVGNALKYSPAESTVEVRTDGDAEGITVVVHNVGEPIAKDAIAHIFEPMQRATSTLKNAARSVGLGLYIVKHLVDAHAGLISVTSTKEAGTTFTLWLPKRPPAS
jgi:signal transduction histidine kinase